MTTLDADWRKGGPLACLVVLELPLAHIPRVYPATRYGHYTTLPGKVQNEIH